MLHFSTRRIKLTTMNNEQYRPATIREDEMIKVFESESNCKWNEALCPRCKKCVNTAAISCKHCGQYFVAVRIPKKIREKFIEEGDMQG